MLGLILLFCGFLTLIDPVAVDNRNCGSALLRKQVSARPYAERCDAKLDRRRLPGFVMSILGGCVMIAIGPRCLLEAD